VLSIQFLVRQYHLACWSSGQIKLIKCSVSQIVSSMCVVQGVLGIKVKIMLDWDPKGKFGPITPLPDLVTIHAPKEEDELRPPVLVPEL
jgi:hypothetical protein